MADKIEYYCPECKLKFWITSKFEYKPNCPYCETAHVEKRDG